MCAFLHRCARVFIGSFHCAHRSATVFSPSRHVLFALFRRQVLPALPPVVAAAHPVPVTTPPATRSETSAKQSSENHQPERLEKSDDRETKNGYHQVIPQEHGEKGDGRDKEQSKENSSGYPSSSRVFHCDVDFSPLASLRNAREAA